MWWCQSHISESRYGAPALVGVSDLGHPPIAAHVLPGEDVALLVVTLSELAHGVARANTPERKSLRQQFLRELMTALPVHPVSVAVALRAGQIDGENSAEGVRLALSDLLIGVTALTPGFGVATGNVRHFKMVPGLRVVVL
jgi:predicted nucleic acid-binding protein